MNTLQVLQRLNNETKAEVYIVGGYVRDLLRNKKNDDLDIVIRGLSLKNIKKFLIKYGLVKEINLIKTSNIFSINIMLFKAFGDVTEAQISLPRRGKKQIPDSHNTLRQDSKFRDFKINAMYLPICAKSKRDVIDIVNGKADIANRKITSNGSAVERIKESPIRMLRVISLAARMNYTIDSIILRAITSHSNLILRCPVEAIRKHFNRILLSKKPSKYLRILVKTGLMRYISPELNNCVESQQDKRYHKFDVFTHLIYTCDNSEKGNLVLRLAGLLHDIGKPDTRRVIKVHGKANKITFYKHEIVSTKLAMGFLRRLKYDNDFSKEVLTLIKYHMYHYTREWTDGAVRKFIKHLDIPSELLTEENISSFPLFKLREAERKGNGYKTIGVTERQKDFEKRLISVYKNGQCLNIRDLNINGNILMKMFNLSTGVKIGKILEHLLSIVIEDPDKNTEVELLKSATVYLHKEG